MLRHCKVSNDVKGYHQLLKESGNQYYFVMEAADVYDISYIFFLHEHNC